MARSRTRRLGEVRRWRRRYRFLAAFVGVAVIASVIALVGAGLRQHRPIASRRSQDASATVALASAQTSETSMPIEVPNIVGTPFREAEVTLSAVGLRVVAVCTKAAAEGTVTAQEPAAGTTVHRGATVRAWTASRSARSLPKRSIVVVIDPGHQAFGDARMEPIGPGAKDGKPRATVGAVGVRTGAREYAITLDVAKRLAKVLSSAGVRVVLTRTNSTVSISNVERARMANRAKAALFLRLHADDSTDPTLRGVITAYPARNEWTAAIDTRSLRAARIMQRAVVVATKARDRGLDPRADMSGFNWSRVPTISVVMGLLSNAADDQQLQESRYRDELANGMADGVLRYLGLVGGRQ